MKSSVYGNQQQTQMILMVIPTVQETSPLPNPQVFQERPGGTNSDPGWDTKEL